MSGHGEGHMVACVLAFALLAANVAGYAFDLYAAFWWSDRVLHTATILALPVWLAVTFLGEGIRKERTLLFIVLVASVGVAIGALWEVAEWMFDRFASSGVIKGKDDTVIESVMHTLGAAAAAVLAQWFRPNTSLPAAMMEASARVR